MGPKLRKTFDILESGGYCLLATRAEVSATPAQPVSRTEKMLEIIGSGGYSLLLPKVEPIHQPPAEQ